MKAHSEPSAATVKYLYAHAFICAFPGCHRPLYRLNENSGVRTLNSRVCHINARREGGPRWDNNQTESGNRSEENLILLCIEHSSVIDNPNTVNIYNEHMLRDWKSKQFAAFEKLNRQNWMIDEDMAKDVIASSSEISSISVRNVDLGGKGGGAPGAGGGGGGAIGHGSIAGRGGNGGGSRVDKGPYSLPFEEVPKDQLALARKLANLDVVPGAGGGGGGAIGNDLVAGNGGDGGESVVGLVDIEALRKVGFHHIEIVIGKGGDAKNNAEDAILNFVTENGVVLKSIMAQAGKSGDFYLPENIEPLSFSEISKFKVPVIMPASAVDRRDNVVSMLSGGWSRFLIPSLPIQASWGFVCCAHWEAIDATKSKGFVVAIVGPEGRERSHYYPIIDQKNAEGKAGNWIGCITTEFDRTGIWRLRVRSEGVILNEFPVVVEVIPPT